MAPQSRPGTGSETMGYGSHQNGFMMHDDSWAARIEELQRENAQLKQENAELKQKQVQIKSAKELYLKIFEDFPALIWRSGLDKECDYFNKTWLEWTGKTIEQEVGHGWTEGVHPDDFDRCLDIYVTAFDRREAFYMEYRLLHKDGSYRWIADHGRPFYDLDNTFLGYIGSCYDINEKVEGELLLKRRTIEVLEQSNKELEEANQRVVAQASLQLQHFACMSHEIRTPLNCIVGISSLLKDDQGLNAGQQESLQMIHSSSNLLRSIIDDVLDYSKLQHGGQVEIGPTNLHDVVHGIVQSLSSSQLAMSKSIKIKKWCDPALEPFIETDERRLSQILLNLLSNGVKFSNDKGVVDLDVCPAGTPDQPMIRFVVTDHGKGIEKEHFESIFEPFHQTKLGIESVGGTGLGLSITKKLVEALEGTISVSSEVGSWTTFTVELPLRVSSHPDITEVHAVKEASRTLDLKELKVLIAEDNQVNQKVLVRILKRIGLDNVDVVNNGQKAVEAEAAKPYDVVLMDMQMPVMDGVDACRRIVARDEGSHPRARVVFVTAHVSSSFKAKCIENGAFDYLAKPCCIEGVTRCLEQVSCA